MSYILDALRKSDAQRRLGQPPDLGSSGPTPAPGKRRKRRLGLFLVILATLTVVAVAIGGRMSGPWQQWLAGNDVAEQPAPGVTPTPPARQLPATSDPTETVSADEDASESLADTRTEETDAEEGTAVVDRRSPSQRPVTVVSRPAPPRPVEPPVPAGERERWVKDAAEAQRLIEAAESAAPASPESPAALTAEPDDLPAIEDQPWTPERAEFMRQWELPLAIRRDLPDLRLSIHVFSVQPEDRFVLINGERRSEGDDLGSGARLVEIRREGALVAFRDYRFLLEP